MATKQTNDATEQFAYYLPAMPQPSAESGRLERFVQNLFGANRQ